MLERGLDWNAARAAYNCIALVCASVSCQLTERLERCLLKKGTNRSGGKLVVGSIFCSALSGSVETHGFLIN